MKAVVATDYGPPERFTVAELQVPEPGPGEIQVRVAATGLNPGDVRIPAGEFRETLALPFPHVPGNDFAGTVSAVGDGIAGYAVDDEVFGLSMPRALGGLFDWPRQPALGTGSLAEYAVFRADTELIAHRPAGLSVEQAAALPTVGATALAIMRIARVKPGETVLVVGATGGVGTTVLPLLAAAGATVIATAHQTDADLVRSLGATSTIGYGDYPREVDLAVNLVLPGDRSTELTAAIRSGGRLVAISWPLPTPNSVGRDDIEVATELELAAMREIGELAVRGELRATIGRRYSLDQGPRALVDFAREHTTGKLVVTA